MCNIRVFLSHSFDETSQDNLPSDVQIAEKVKEILDDLNVPVVTGSQPEARNIPERLTQQIDQCNVVLCIFRKRHQVAKDKWIPSQYVLSESAFAMGRFRDRQGKLGVYALVENGVDRNDLGIAFDSGVEVIPFSRKDFAACELKLRDYINGSSFVPPGFQPLEFWHDILQWYGDYAMREVDETDIWYRVYSHTERDLTGQMRAVWQPTINYHAVDEPPKKKRTARKSTKKTARRKGS